MSPPPPSSSYLEIFRFNVKLFNGFIGKHISRCLEGNDVAVFVEDFKQDRTMVLAIAILGEIQLDKRLSIQFL